MTFSAKASVDLKPSPFTLAEPVSAASFGKSGKQEVGGGQGATSGVAPVPERATTKFWPSSWLVVALTVKLELSLKAPDAPGEKV